VSRANAVSVNPSPPASSVSHDSILLTHTGPASRAYVLLHGITTTPMQFAEFGRLLHDRGANVYIPRLPRHGLADRLTTELEGLTAGELRAFALATAAYGATLGERLRIVGFSVGGLLAAWIGQRIAVDRITAVAPFLGVSWIPRGLTGRAARLALRLPNRFMWWDPIRRERFAPAHGYPRYATHAIAEAAILGQELMAEAEYSAPAARDLQIVLNASESTVNNREARHLAALWSAHKGMIVQQRLKGLPFSHDIIEPLRSPRLSRQVSTALLQLVER
jgi:alpha-beta hydrolase superfamily lysophospholipase